jgi:hypothetical protein
MFRSPKKRQAQIDTHIFRNGGWEEGVPIVVEM